MQGEERIIQEDVTVYHAHRKQNCYFYTKRYVKHNSQGHDTHNCHGCLLTFYDALDTLVVLGNRTEFQRVVKWLGQHGAAAFDRDQTVSERPIPEDPLFFTLSLSLAS